jgi:outer membrane biosynthesis protein TonB
MPDFPLQRKWELGLDALRFAAASEMLVEGRKLLDALDALGPVPEEQRFYADQVRVRFPALEPQPEPEPQPVEQPVPETPVETPPADTPETPEVPKVEDAPADGGDGSGQLPKMVGSTLEM